MIYYKPVKITINTLGFVKVIINVVVRHHGLSDSIVNDWDSLFISKFWSLLCYFLGIRPKLSNTFKPHIDGQTKMQNSTIKAYLQTFINF